MNDEHRMMVEQIPHLRRYAQALLGDNMLADDLVQECLTRAMDRLHLWRPGGNMKVWLMSILHNVHVNDAKRRSARPDAVSLAPVHENLHPQPAGQDQPFLLRDMNQALNQLPDEQRNVIVLIGREGLAYAEAAEVLDVPVGTVMSRLGRGRRNLREYLDADGTPRLRKCQVNSPKSMSPDDMQRFVEGRMAPGEQVRMEAWLAENPEDAAAVHAYRLQNAALSQTFDSVLDEPVPAGLEDIVTMRAAPGAPAPVAATQSPRMAAWMCIAATLVIFIAGGIAGWLLHGNAPAPGAASFAANAMGAHRIFVAERRHAVEVPSNQEAPLFKWLSKRLGVTLKAPDLADAGFRLMGGRLLADGPLPAAQFMYVNADKVRMTVYVRAAGTSSGNTEFRFADAQGTSAFYWVDAKFAYAFVAPIPRAPLLNIANRIHGGLDR
jgi:RNA polymerase sigma factor (sigma-70 family)